MNKLKIKSASNPKGKVISFFDSEVRLKQDEINTVRQAFNPFRDQVKEALEESTKWKWSYFNSGSHYDGTKVTRADEIDCMFTPSFPSDWFDVIYDGAPAGFCFVELKTSYSLRAPNPALMKDLEALCDNGRLNSDKFRKKVFDDFKVAVQGTRSGRRVTVQEVKSGCPSYAVELDAIPSQDGSGLKPISIDLVPGLHMSGLPPGAEENLHGAHIRAEDVRKIIDDGFDVIPKQCKRAGFKRDRHLLWRLSFSRAEKQLTLYADKRLRQDGAEGAKSPPTCRKSVLRYLKRILELIKGFDNSRETEKPNPTMIDLQKAVTDLKTAGRRRKEIEHFSTFQIRTLMWREFYVNLPDNNNWLTPEGRARLVEALQKLKRMVAGDLDVRHFFVPEQDIMSDVPRHEREFLYIMFYIAKEIL